MSRQHERPINRRGWASALRVGRTSLPRLSARSFPSLDAVKSAAELYRDVGDRLSAHPETREKLIPVPIELQEMAASERKQIQNVYGPNA